MNFPPRKFGTIYADPPWSFRTFSAKGQGRSAERHYATMSIPDIAALPVSDLAMPDDVLLMWATMPLLPEAIDVMRSWGFRYKTCAFTWMKQRRKAAQLFTDRGDVFAGMGYWTRSNCELCLLGTRGKPKRRSAAVKQAILSPLREHSRKPEETYDRIEALVDGPYIELFARNTRPGWESWGNQTDKFGEVVS
jgi:N6-adenosine-specific RNA methylase IME4